jgi:heptosyltransferase-3
MSTKAAIFLHNGLGDGVNGLVLSNNLQLNGWRVDTYQNMMGALQSWVPHLPILPYPPLSELSKILSSYDLFFIVHNDTDEFVLKLIEEGKRRFPDRLKVIYLYPSKHIVDEPYYADCLVDPTRPIAENFTLFCEKILHLPKITQSNGFIPPAHLVHRKFKKRVVIHPTSARITRNWPQEKFVKLALHLKEEGYEIHFVPGEKEKEAWFFVLDLGFHLPIFPHLDALAGFIYESRYLIGNDSGLGHLASSLGIPVLTFCRKRSWANMWAPSFQKGVVVTPSSLIPNISGFRLRDRHWKKFISVAMARRGFERLIQTSDLSS